MESYYPQDINLFTTYRCNSKCQNCLIWKGSEADPYKIELDSEQLERLFDDPLFVRCTSLGLAGGEPTISPFFWKLLDLLPGGKRVNISTNALNSEKLVDLLRRSPYRDKYEIQVSIDGIGDTNDRIRGVKGAFRKSVALLEMLEGLGVDRLLSFTINRSNYHQLKECYDLANSHGAEFCTRMAHMGGAYRNRESRGISEFEENELEVLDNAFDMIISEELRKSSHFPARLVFMKKITDYFRGIQEDLPCGALKTAMVIDLYGDVFPKCPLFMMKGIGNLHEQDLSNIWEGDNASETRARIDKLQCGGCWNDCQVVTNIALDREFFEEEYGKLKIAYFRERGFPGVIDFTQGEDRLLIGGWYEPEGDSDFRFRWTEQEFSILLPEGISSLELFAAVPFTSSSDGLWRADVLIGGQLVDSVAFSNPEWRHYPIALQRPTSELTLCKFKLNRYCCPKDNGMSEDERHLGMAINKISFMKE
ncbi:MAG: radical SAM protein [Thermodesulfobacteriota bacterium]|nr:radical SAM protein [Thermodesulfobacteriota bacterium]